MKEYDFLVAVDSILAYHRGLMEALGWGPTKEEYDRLGAKAEATREILIGFTEFMAERDKEPYREKLRRRLVAAQEDMFFSKIV